MSSMQFARVVDTYDRIEATTGQVMSEVVMIALVGKGLGRQEAHQLIRNTSQKARTKGLDLRDALLAEPNVTQLLTKKEIDAALDPVALHRPGRCNRRCSREAAPLGRTFGRLRAPVTRCAGNGGIEGPGSNRGFGSHGRILQGQRDFKGPRGERTLEQTFCGEPIDGFPD